MVERAEHRAEESADVAGKFFLLKIGSGIVDARIGPLIVGRKHHEMLFHSSIRLAANPGSW